MYFIILCCKFITIFLNNQIIIEKSAKKFGGFNYFL